MKLPSRRPQQEISIESRLRRLLLLFFLPLVAMIVALLLLMLSYNREYNELLHNVTAASEFNQDFKQDIDLKMYYYVIGSQYSEGLPIQDVDDAIAIAEGLLETTGEKESRKAIQSVLSLSENLKNKMYLIQATDSYDERQSQLENNIYIITDLIQEYMYDYLYSEAYNLDTLQTAMTARIYQTTVLVSLGILAVLCVLLRQSLRFSRTITAPISALCARVEAIGQGDLSVQTPVAAKEYEIQTLSDGFEQMVSRLNQLMEDVRQEQTRLRSAELALLQAQINPHFLYNTLDTIIWLIETDRNQEATEMVGSLSTFFRASLSQGRDIITLSEEERHVRAYLEIQQVRYRDILDYTIDIDPALAACRLPKLTLQPLVENALYHGIKCKRGPGRITITGREEGELVILTVSDDGAGMAPERLEQLRQSLTREGEKVGFGLRTVHQRLQLLFGAPYGLSLQSEPGAGAVITVTIPQQREEAVL